MVDNSQCWPLFCARILVLHSPPTDDSQRLVIGRVSTNSVIRFDVGQEEWLVAQQQVAPVVVEASLRIHDLEARLFESSRKQPPRTLVGGGGGLCTLASNIPPSPRTAELGFECHVNLCHGPTDFAFPSLREVRVDVLSANMKIKVQNNK